ncbi:hypothetical protein [Gluconobacter albidus]|uniref:hypothetical protein n=1 Tax=Gluconobacter albidus TaxID=318683 RepID=UPI001B8D2288|nr:hypothetical protein [Gluconobacter albidus]MBS1028311.1 hypothetical protein [Gluconobacter albidus]
MAVSPQSLCPGTTLTASDATIVTGASGTTVLTSSTFANPTTAAATLTIKLTRSGGAAITLVPGRSVAAAATVQPPELAGLILSANDTLTASGDGITAVVNGYVAS